MKKIIITIICWIVAELFFNLIGIDEIIDWNDFVLQQNINHLCQLRQINN